MVIIVAFFSVIHPFGLLALLAAGALIALLKLKPHFALFLSFLSLLDFLSMTNPNFLSIPGLFKLKDILFFAMFIPLFMNMTDKKDAQFKSPLYTAILLMLPLFTMEALYTVLVENQRLNLVISDGRRYLYYLIFFQTIYILRSRGHVRTYIRLLIGAGLTFSVLVILQNHFGQSVHIFLAPTKIESQTLSQVHVTRSYVTGTALANFLSYVCFFRALTQKKLFLVNLTLFLLIFVGGVVLSYTRALWIGNVVGCITGLIVFKRYVNFKRLVQLLAVFALMLCIALPAKALISNDATDRHDQKDFLVAHMTSAIDELMKGSGNFGYRLRDSAARIQYIKQHPIFGAGFIHANSEKNKTLSTWREGFATGDSGIITLLMNYGLIGLIWLVFFISSFIRECLRTIRVAEQEFRPVIIAAFSFIICSTVSFITLGDFVFTEGIVVLATASAMILISRKFSQRECYA